MSFANKVKMKFAEKTIEYFVKQLLNKKEDVARTALALNITVAEAYRLLNKNKGYDSWIDVFKDLFEVSYFEKYRNQSFDFSTIFEGVKNDYKEMDPLSLTGITRFLTVDFGPLLLVEDGEVQGDLTTEEILESLPPSIVKQYTEEDGSITDEKLASLITEHIGAIKEKFNLGV